MNEYKVQLESREDLIFLKNEMMKYFDEKCNGTVNEASKQQYFEKVFSIIAENCQVNGVDFSELILQNSKMEAVNNDLVTKLQDLQAETETLLHRTIEYRRQVPQIVKEAFVKESGKNYEGIQREIERDVQLGKEDVELCNVDRGIKPNFYSNKLSSGLSHLTQLQSTIPDVAAKLERAQNVITEEGGKRLDESTQLLHRHRRLSRQFDLASKIGNL